MCSCNHENAGLENGFLANFGRTHWIFSLMLGGLTNAHLSIKSGLIRSTASFILFSTKSLLCISILAVRSRKRGIAIKGGNSESIFPDMISAQSFGRFLAKGETGAFKIITLK
jgi:hypothetical protein